MTTVALGADLPPLRPTETWLSPSTQPAPPPPASPGGIFSEARVGMTAHDPWSPERGSVDINGEVIFAKPYISADPTVNAFIPRIHLGGSVHTAGKTSYAYAGLTWTYDVTNWAFVEATFGGAIHNGDTSLHVLPDRNALGCSPLFRESAAVGFRVTEHWSLLATIDHMSNAGLCSHEVNRGLTNVGGKISYRF